MRQRERQTSRWPRFEPLPAAEQEQNQRLDGYKQDRQRNDELWFRDQQPEIQRHADCGEEDTEQQTFERRDIGLEFVAIAAFGKQRAGNESAEAGR